MGNQFDKVRSRSSAADFHERWLATLLEGCTGGLVEPRNTQLGLKLIF